MRTFYMLSAVQMISAIGSAMTGIAVGIWLFVQTGDVTPVLMVAFFSSLPPVLAGAFTGVLIDRFDKRAVLILSDTGQAAGTLILLLALGSGHFSLELLYAIVTWQSACAMFAPPTMLALTTALVPEGQRERANAVGQSTGRLAGILAPGCAGLLYSAAGLTGIVALDLMTFLVAVLITGFILPRAKASGKSAARPSFRRDLLEGVRFLRAHPALLGLILHGTVINFFLSAVLTLTTPYILTLTTSEALTGAVLSALNVGALAGAMIIGLWGGTRPRIHTIMPAILAIALAVIGYGLAASSLSLTVAAFFMLLPMPFVTTLIPAILQSRTPPALQGRVFAVMFQLASLANPLALLLTGFLIDRILEPALIDQAPGTALRLFIVISGAAMFIVTLGVYSRRAIRQVESDAA